MNTESERSNRMAQSVERALAFAMRLRNGGLPVMAWQIERDADAIERNQGLCGERASPNAPA